MEKFKVWKVVIKIKGAKESSLKKIMFNKPSMDKIIELTREALQPFQAVGKRPPSTITDIHTQIIEHEFEFTDGSEL